MDQRSAASLPYWTMFIESVKIVVFLALADVTVSAYYRSVALLKIGLDEMPAITGAIIVSLIFQAACGFPVFIVITQLQQEINYPPVAVQNYYNDLLVCALFPIQFLACACEFLFTAPSNFYTGFAAYCARTVLHVAVICMTIDMLGQLKI